MSLSAQDVEAEAGLHHAGNHIESPHLRACSKSQALGHRSGRSICPVAALSFINIKNYGRRTRRIAPAERGCCSHCSHSWLFVKRIARPRCESHRSRGVRRAELCGAVPEALCPGRSLPAHNWPLRLPALRASRKSGPPRVRAGPDQRNLGKRVGASAYSRESRLRSTFPLSLRGIG